jgi:general secretion pathway protein I
MCAEYRPRGRRPTGGRTSAEGFTLLEVVVALAIAGLAFALLFRAGSSGLLAVDTAGTVEEAVERAQSHLAALGRDAALVEGERSGDDGGGYRWWLSIHPIAAHWLGPGDVRGPGSTTILYDVEVRISWAAGGRERSVALRSERLGAAPNAGQ